MLTPGSGGNRQNPSRWMNAPVERQLAEQQQVIDISPSDRSTGGQYTQRNRQIE
jgi:hypothetical protein